MSFEILLSLNELRSEYERTLIMKRLIRAPIRSLVTFLILFSMMFMLTTQVLEYVSSYFHVYQTSKMYRGVGWAEIEKAENASHSYPIYIEADPRVEMKGLYNAKRYEPISRETIDGIVSLTGVDSYDLRYMTAGISDEFLRIDEGLDYYNYGARMIVEATISNITYGNYIDNFKVNAIDLSDCKLLAGNLKHMPLNNEMRVKSTGEELSPGMWGGFRNNTRGISAFTDTFKYDTEYLKELKLNERYIFVLRYEPLESSHMLKHEFYLGDHLTNGWCEAIQKVGTSQSEYLDSQEFAAISELIDITNNDQHTFDVVYTNNQLSIRRFVESKMHVESGRAIDVTDSNNKRNVCVISSTFALMNDLEVGDRLTFKLGTVLHETHKGLGTLAVTRERYSETTNSVVLEIVGIYDDIDERNEQANTLNWSYSVNTVFVPTWLLKVDEKNLTSHMFSPNEFSFIIGNPWNVSAYNEAINTNVNDAILENVYLTLNDNGWLSIENQFKTFSKVSFFNILVTTMSFLVVLYYVVYSYIGKKKKEFAIMRALGTPVIRAKKVLLSPIITITASAFIAGTLSAYINSFKRQLAMLEFTDVLESTYVLSYTTKALLVLLCLTFAYFVATFFIKIQVKKLEKQSPLSLLQSDSDHLLMNKIMVLDGLLKAMTLKVSTYFLDMLGKSSYKIRYLVRRLTRLSFRTLIYVLLSTTLFSALIQFHVLYESNVQLYRDTTIYAKFIDGLPLDSVSFMLDQSLAENLYYEYAHQHQKHMTMCDVVVTNDVERYTGESPNMILSKKYTIKDVGEFSDVCLVGETFLEDNNLSIGRRVNMYEVLYRPEVEYKHIKRYRSMFKQTSLMMTDKEIIELLAEAINKELMDNAVYFTIAGKVVSPSGLYNNTVFMAGENGLFENLEFDVLLDYVDLKISDNYRLDEFRAYSDSIKDSNIKVVMDTSKIDKLEHTIDVMQAIQPIVMTGTILISCIVGVFVTLNNLKEISILRILGTPPKAISIIFVVENLVLLTISMILGLSILTLYNGNLVGMLGNDLFVIAVLFCTCTITLIFVSNLIASRRIVSRQLQVKE